MFIVFQSRHVEDPGTLLGLEITESILGLLINITTESSTYGQSFGANLCNRCLHMLKSEGCSQPLRQRGVTLLSHILPSSPEAVDSVTEAGGTALLLECLKVESFARLSSSFLQRLTVSIWHRNVLWSSSISDLLLLYVNFSYVFFLENNTIFYRISF